MGDSGRSPNYLLNTDVDRSLSDSCRGYVFSDQWTYAVIERRRLDGPFPARDPARLSDDVATQVRSAEGSQRNL